MKISSEKVLRILTAEGISVEELAYMVEHAAITSIDGCNRRYHQWAFRVEGAVLLDMRYAQLMSVGRGHAWQTEEHEPCLGDGCRECGWVGEVLRGIEDTTQTAIDLTN